MLTDYATMIDPASAKPGTTGCYDLVGLARRMQGDAGMLRRNYGGPGFAHGARAVESDDPVARCHDVLGAQSVEGEDPPLTE